MEKMCLGAGQGQARKGVRARCDFRQQFCLEIGEKMCKNFTNTFTYPSVCVGVRWHVCGSPRVWRLEDNGRSQTSLSTFEAGSFVRLGDRRH